MTTTEAYAPALPVSGGPTKVWRGNLGTASHEVQRAATVAALRLQPQSRSALTVELGLSASAVSRLVGGLIANAMLVEIGVEASGIGRPRTTLGLAPDAGRVLSLVLGPATLDCQVVDLAGNLISAAATQITTPIVDPQTVLDFVAAALEPQAGSPLWGMGVSAPGVVDASGALRAAPDLGWTDAVGLRQLLVDRFDTLVTVDNDVNLMIVAEATSGWAQDKRDAAFIYLGNRGIGLGAISHGTLLTGATGASGEIGLLPLELSPGRPMSFEQGFSFEAVSAVLAHEGIEPGADPMASLVRAARDGIAVPYLESLVHALTQALGIVSLILDPEIVVLGGALRTVCLGREEELEHALESWVPASPRVQLSGLGEQEIHWAAQTRCWDQIIATGL